jgi:5-methylcytosine-specific restriction endonuclease McrA
VAERAEARAARAARERAATGWSWENNSRQRYRLIDACLARYGTVCHLCRRAEATTADHLIPRSAGGANTLDNLRPACGPCNTARGGMPLTVWFAKHPVPRTQPLPPSRQW